jgi:hypothetical protein
MLWILALLLSNSLTNTADALSGACTKPGATRTVKSVTYRCALFSSRLRWQKIGANLKPATTSTTTLPMPTDEVARKTQLLVTEAMKSTAVQSVRIEYLTEEPASALDVTSKKEGLDKALKLYAQLGFDWNRSIIVVFGRTNDGVRSMLLAQGCRGIALGDPNAGVLGGAIDGNCGTNRVAVTVNAPSSPTRQRTSIDFQHELPHEVFHTWQNASTSWCGSWQCGNSDFPRWLWEATPQVMSRLAYWSWNQEKTQQEWHDYWYSAQRPDMRTMCKGVQIEEMIEPWTPWPSAGWCAYSKGQLAIELLIANYGGFETLKRLHSEKKTSGHSDFAQVFQTVTGRSLSDFYQDANSYFRTRGWD